jgi:hypothetical protein
MFVSFDLGGLADRNVCPTGGAGMGAPALSVFWGETGSGDLAELATGTDGPGRPCQAPEPPASLPRGTREETRWTVAEAVNAYMDATEAAEGTRLSYRTTVRRWEEWLATGGLAPVRSPGRSPGMVGSETQPTKLDPRSIAPRVELGLTSVSADHVDDWLEWVYGQAVKAGDKNPANTVNKRRRELRAVMNWAVKRRHMRALPAFPDPREQRKVAGHYFLTAEAPELAGVGSETQPTGERESEIDRLYWATYRMRTPHRWADERSIGSLWRAALVLFYHYGFDTQLLFRRDERITEVMRWSSVCPLGLPPGRVANVNAAYGWIKIKRQKTGRLLIMPLTEIAAAHLAAIRTGAGSEASAQRAGKSIATRGDLRSNPGAGSGDPRTTAEPGDPDPPIFGLAGGSKPAERFRELVTLARIAEKLDVETGEPTPWVLKDLRKTCATAHNASMPGTAQYVLGHSTGVITDIHYASVLPMLLKCFAALPQPRAFRSIVDETIRPTGMLFAK